MGKFPDNITAGSDGRGDYEPAESPVLLWQPTLPMGSVGRQASRIFPTNVLSLNPGALLVNWARLHVSWMPPKVWMKDNHVVLLDTFS